MSEAKDSIQGLVGYRMRLKNRRVQVGHKPADDGVCIVWTKLKDGKPCDTVVTLSQEAAEATANLLLKVLGERPSAGILHLQGQPNQTGQERVASTDPNCSNNETPSERWR